MSKPVLVVHVKTFDEIVDEGIDGFMLPAHNQINGLKRSSSSR
jgi:hypothetical protein